MKRIFVLASLMLMQYSDAKAQATPVPKPPVQLPSTTAQAYINNYKTNTLNFFAHGYLLEISKVKSMSPIALRVYNGIQNDTIQKMVIAPLNNQFKINTASPCMMQSDERICPKFCDIVGEEDAAQVWGAQVSNTVNACMECLRYESVNALVVFIR